MPRSHILLPPYSRRAILQSMAHRFNFQLYSPVGCGSSGYKCYGDRITIVRFVRSNSVSDRKNTMWLLQGRREAVTWARKPPKVANITRSLYGGRTKALQWPRGDIRVLPCAGSLGFVRQSYGNCTAAMRYSTHLTATSRTPWNGGTIW